MGSPSAISDLQTREDVAQLLNTSSAQLQFLLYGKPEKERYREFCIPKKTGGHRTILAPSPDLKHLQRKLAAVLQDQCRPRFSAHGFVPGKSIRTNAKIHTRRGYILNIDLKDFFPSIHLGRIIGLLMSSSFLVGKEAATVIAQICCFKGSLPQGAPTSPCISNMICFRLDRQLANLAHKYSCRYTRYADDITFSFSSGSFPKQLGYFENDNTCIGKELHDIIEQNNFHVNPQKIFLHSNKSRQLVTGIVVNEKLNVQRRFIRQIRAMINALQKYSLDGAQTEYTTKYYRNKGKNSGAPNFCNVIRGKLAYIKMVKGQSDPVYKNLQKRYVQADKSYAKVMQKENAKLTYRDFFISHASEDKDEIAKPLADALIKAGMSVWYDEYEIQIGDRILAKIHEGLKNSKFGIAIFSHNFFAPNKQWTPMELDALIALSSPSNQKILPIWHNIDHSDMTGYCAPLAGIRAEKTNTPFEPSKITPLLRRKLESS